MNNALNLLSICRKAGKLELGMDPVKDVCRNHKARCVLVSNDISPKSLKEIAFVCSEERIPVLNLDTEMDEIWGALGKRAGILGVCDAGFSKKLMQMLQPLPKDSNTKQ